MTEIIRATALGAALFQAAAKAPDQPNSLRRMVLWRGENTDAGLVHEQDVVVHEKNREYEFRDLPRDTRSGDWCVFGECVESKDLKVRGLGVLEFCRSEEDAIAVGKEMAKYPRQFKFLEAMQFNCPATSVWNWRRTRDYGPYGNIIRPDELCLHYSSYWNMWSRRLYQGPDGFVDFELTPVNPSVEENWQRVNQIYIRWHLTKDYDRDHTYRAVVRSSPVFQKLVAAVGERIDPDSFESMLTYDLMARIDWRKYSAAERNGGIRFEDCKKD